MRSPNYVWDGFFGALALISVAALLAYVVFTPLAGLGVFAFCLTGLFIYQVRNLHRLVQWSREPLGAPVPQAYGVWDYVFADLNRRTKSGLDQRERLAQALTRFREATSAMPDGVMLLSAENFIEWINPAAGRHFELDPRRDVGQPITNLVRQPDFVAFLASEEAGDSMICHLSRHAGTVLSIQVVPFGEDQQMILSRDITRFERLDAMRRDFVANVSHELKTPLTVVGGFLETLDDMLEELPPDEARRYIRLASEQAGRMRRLVEDLLELAALETSAEAPFDETVDMDALISLLMEEADALSAGRHVLTLESNGPPGVRGSRKELHSALLNLVSNAVRYTPAKGKITVRWIAAENGGARFVVEDTGIGIEAHHIPRLTERFYRVDRGRSRESGGTGLGLAIVKHALNRHQAILDVTSIPGHGSCFAVGFPKERIFRPTA